MKPEAGSERIPIQKTASKGSCGRNSWWRGRQTENSWNRLGEEFT
jgi:hypothetical protein